MLGQLKNLAYRGALLALLLIATVTGLVAISPALARDKPSSLKIAVTGDFPPQMTTNFLGKPSGLMIDIWRLWSKKTGVQVEFISSSWRETLSSLREGRVDVHAGLFRSAERESWMAFSKPFYGVSSGIYFPNSRDQMPTLKALAGQKVGAISGTYQESFLINEHPTVETLGFKNTKDLMKALLAGQIQATLQEDPSADYELGEFGLRGDVERAKGNILENAVHAAVTKERSHLIGILNQGFAAISRDEFQEMENRWISDPNIKFFNDAKAEIRLTADEQAWLRDHPITRLAVLKDWPPFDLIDENGHHGGLHKDLIDLMNAQLGTAFNAIPFDTWKDAYDAASKAEVDGIMGLSWTQERSKTFLFSPAYYYAPATLITRADDHSITKTEDLNGKSIWVRANSSLIALIREQAPGAKILLADTPEQALEAIAKNEGDAFIAWLSHDKQAALAGQGLKLAANVDTKQGEFLIGTHKSLPLVASIIRKATNAIPQKKLGEIRAKWFADDVQTRSTDDLTEREKAWIAAHPIIRIGNETDWPPFDYVEDGEAKGYSIGLIKLIAKRVGLKTEFVNGVSWAELLEMFKQRKIDVMPAIAETAERRKFMRFTDHYLTNPTVVVVAKNRPNVEGMAGLTGKFVGVVRGFYYEDTIRKAYPAVNVVAVDSFAAGLAAVRDGELDAFIGSEYVVNYLMTKSDLTGIKVSGRSGIDDVDKFKIRMAVHKTQPILVSILQKGLRQIEVIEDRELRDKWIWSRGDLRSQDSSSDEVASANDVTSVLVTQIAGIALVIVLAFVLLTTMLRRFTKERDNANLYDSPEIRLIGFLSVGLFLGVVILTATITLNRVETQARKEIGDNLAAVLETTREALSTWINSQLHQAKMLARSPGVRYPVERLLEGLKNGSDLKQLPQQSELQSMVSGAASMPGIAGIDVIAPNRLIIGSTDIERIGRQTTIAGTREKALSQAFNGKGLFIPPVADQGGAPVMFFAAPIRADKGRVLAVLAIRADPSKDFSRIAGLGRVSRTGETYALDEAGRMLTASRYEKDLTDLGLIGNGEKSILGLHVKTPGDGTASALTRMAQEVTAGRSGRDTEGYLDYRGTRVLGVWLWDSELGIGLTTEIDEDNGLSSFNTIRTTVFGALGGTVLLSLILTGLSVWIGQTATRSLAKARDQLEDRVEERTTELAEKENQMRVAMENMPGALVYTDQNLEMVFCNDRFFEMADLPRDLVRPGMPYPVVLRYMADHGYFGPGDPSEQVAERVNSLINPDESITVAYNPDGRVSEVRRQPIAGGGTVTVITDITQRKEAERALEDAHELITDSINYASHIQRSLLPQAGAFDASVADHFEVWEPKDVVGGDLYWCRESKGGPLIIVGDCTGHGVPGAFMTLISTGAINQALLEIPEGDPAKLLVRVNQIIKASTGQEGSEGKSDDGLELGICRLNRARESITYAGARFSIFLSRKGVIEEIKGDKRGLGYRHISMIQDYNNHEINTADVDGFYMTSDGLIDQPGGIKRRGFGKKRFKAVLAEVHGLPMGLQRERLLAAFADYQGEESRRDDLSIIGFNI